MPSIRMLLLCAAVGVTLPGSAAAEWQPYVSRALGVAVDIPAHIFGEARREARAETFVARERGARLRLFSFRKPPGESPAAYLRRIADPRSARFTYVRTTARFFAASGVKGGDIFYRRCNFPARAGARVACADLVYPRADKRAWDAVVTRISRSLHGID